jgi:hypothetical protein
MRTIRLTIDRLVLNGIERQEGTALTDALPRQLAHVLADLAARDGWKSSRLTPVVKLRMPLEPGLTGARKLGAGMARAIAKSLKP